MKRKRVKPIPVSKKYITNRNIILFLSQLVVFSILINTTIYSVLRGESHPNEFSYPLALYDQGDYYRAISEFLRLKEDDSVGKNNPEIDLYLLKSYLKLKQYDQIEILAGSILEKRSHLHDPAYISEASSILSISYLETENFGKAEEIWQRYLDDSQNHLFPLSKKLEGEIEPEKAKLYSTILPGAGMVLTGEYGKAVVAFLVNALFIAGSYQSFNKEQYGLAGIFCFFEISFYVGGRNASYESAENHNNQLKREFYRSWKASQLEYIFR
ncbi:hypothetical protein KKA14_18375 [bacterium]|nr:hypothetical protein [bacterium]